MLPNRGSVPRLSMLDHEGGEGSVSRDLRIDQMLERRGIRVRVDMCMCYVNSAYQPRLEYYAIVWVCILSLQANSPSTLPMSRLDTILNPKDDDTPTIRSE